MDISTLTLALRDFVHEREWEKFQTPKNLSMALSVEAAELMEHFQWLDGRESRELSPEKHAAVRDEMADVLIYLVRLADELDVDLLEAAESKMVGNRRRYPPEKVRGVLKKAAEYL